MPDVNIPLLRKAVEWAEAEAQKPDEISEWNQQWWVTPPESFEVEFGEGVKSTDCGTCYCIAGFVVAQTLRPGESIQDGEFIRQPDGDSEWIPERARQELGIVWSSGLFAAHNSIEDVRRIAEEIAGERL